MTVQIAYARRPLARKSFRTGLTPLGPDQFEGYASLFNVADGAGDTVAPGAFAASLRRRGAGQVRLLYQHFAHSPIGVWEEIAEDSRGLYVRGRLLNAVEQARDVGALLAEGASVVRTFSGVTQNSQLYTAAQQSSDFPSGLPNPLTVQVYQLSPVIGRGRMKKENLYVR